MMRYKFSKREAALFAFTLTLVAGAVFIFFVVEPLSRSILKLNAAIHRKRYLLSQQYYFINHGENIKSLRQKYRDILKEFSSPEEITEYFFEAVKRLASQRGLSVRRIKPLAITRQKDFREVSLELEFEGNFKSLFQLIADLENSPALININSMTIRSLMRDNKRLRCRMNLSKIFF